MRQRSHGFIAISNTVGHPDFFIIMTCSTAGFEITRELLENQKGQDQSYFCACVFYSS